MRLFLSCVTLGLLLALPVTAALESPLRDVPPVNGVSFGHIQYHPGNHGPFVLPAGTTVVSAADILSGSSVGLTVCSDGHEDVCMTYCGPIGLFGQPFAGWKLWVIPVLIEEDLSFCVATAGTIYHY